MKALLFLPALIFLYPATTEAQLLNEHRWKSRLVLVFTPSPDDPTFTEQLRLFREAEADLAERKIKLLLLSPKKGETERPVLAPNTSKEYYTQFRVAPNVFTVILIGLDGGEKRRTVSQVFQPTDLFGMIDQMPMRRQEMRRKFRSDGE